MTSFPLFFTYRDHLFGNGFLAEVSSHGRILSAVEDGEHWVYGVEPGGISATGENAKAAVDAYRQAFTNVLRDLAAEAPTFAAFTESVERFFNDVNRESEHDWQAAVEAVRRGSIDVPPEAGRR